MFKLVVKTLKYEMNTPKIIIIW